MKRILNAAFAALLIVSAGTPVVSAAAPSFADQMKAINEKRARDYAAARLHIAQEHAAKTAEAAAVRADDMSAGGGSAGGGESIVLGAVPAYEETLYGSDAGVRHYEPAATAVAAASNLLECPICTEAATDTNPLIAPYACTDMVLGNGTNAGHKLCKSCYKEHRRHRAGVFCPLCRAGLSGATIAAESEGRSEAERLFDAAENGRIDEVRAALDAGFNVNTVLEYLQKPHWYTGGAIVVHAWAAGGQISFNYTLPETYRKTLLTEAVRGHGKLVGTRYVNNLSMITMLFERGARPDVTDIQEGDLLKMVMTGYTKNSAIIEQFLTHGAPVQLMFNYLCDHFNGDDQDYEILDVFLHGDFGITIDTLGGTAELQHTILHGLVTAWNPANLNAIIDRYHMNINTLDSTGKAPLHWAMLRVKNAVNGDFNDIGSLEMPEQMDVFKVLLNRSDFDVTALGDAGPHVLKTLLHVAAAVGDIELFKLLLNRYHVDPRISLANGNTPLHTAAATNIGAWRPWLSATESMINYLVRDMHMDVNATNNEGKRPIDIVNMEQHAAIHDQLFSLGLAADGSGSGGSTGT